VETSAESDGTAESKAATSRFSGFFEALRDAILRDFALLEVLLEALLDAADLADFCTTTADFAFFVLALERTAPEPLASA
jgi:hypothetical protein